MWQDEQRPQGEGLTAPARYNTAAREALQEYARAMATAATAKARFLHAINQTQPCAQRIHIDTLAMFEALAHAFGVHATETARTKHMRVFEFEAEELTWVHVHGVEL